jgi:hypothetical protein
VRAILSHEVSEVDALTVPISDHLSIRAYSDTKPHNWKIADLQKGLILVHEGIEMVGEGTGFGFPVVVYEDETFFPGSAKVFAFRQAECFVIRKEYLMDRVGRNRFRNVAMENRKTRSLSKYLANLYQSHRHLRFLSLKGLLMDFGVRSNFVRSSPAGKVPVSFVISKNIVEINAKFDLLSRKKPLKVFMLNEQGSRFFRRYCDSSGTELFDKGIGAWDLVQPDWASLTTMRGEAGFRLWKKQNAVLRVGREFLDGSLDWVGLDYEVDPETKAFQYAVEILGGKR